MNIIIMDKNFIPSPNPWDDLIRAWLPKDHILFDRLDEVTLKSTDDIDNLVINYSKDIIDSSGKVIGMIYGGDVTLRVFMPIEEDKDDFVPNYDDLYTI